MKTLLLSILALTYSALCFCQVTINEVDSQTPGADMAEFVELYAATETSLDGHVLVLFNGSDNASYLAVNLDGNTITDGYFVIGNAATPNVDLVIDDNSLQNGADAVGLYTGSADDFPEDTPVTATNLVDYMVYGTGDADDTELLAILMGACQVQADEDSNGDDDNQSNSRVPDGGTALCPTDFVQQASSPGVTNVPNCFGGMLSLTDGTDMVEFCLDDEMPMPIAFTNTAATGDGTVFLITDEDNIILTTTTETSIDATTFMEGVCRIHAISYTGTLDTETLSEGEDAVDVATDGDCLSFASNFITVSKVICNPECDGGTVTSDIGTEATLCLDDENGIVLLSNTSLSSDATYTYVSTDTDNNIIMLNEAGAPDFSGAVEGIYRFWGVSYTGTLDATSIEAGAPLFGISSDMCSDISENYVEITVQACEDVEGCGSIFFSEYQEGGGNNKALEIYNPTQLPVSLADYQLVNCSNGCASLDEWEFTNDIFGGATIAPGDVFVVAHPDADPAILAEADVQFQFLSNGDDVFALQQISTLEIIDIIGEQTLEDIGDGWTVSGVENGTQNHTLVRLETVNEGTTDWAVGQDQWEVLDQDTFENLGSHTIIPCTVNDDPMVSFSAASVSVDEDAGTVTVEVNILNPLDIDMTVDVMITGGTAVSPDDYDAAGFPMTLTFPAGMDTPQTFSVTIVDDMMEEGAETITMELANASDGIMIGAGDFTLTINESDVTIQVLDIVDAAEVDADGVAVNLDLECELRAVVYGVNMRPAGLQFTLIDPTDGIGVFLFEGDLGYTVNEGDSVHVVGTIGQFNGLTQIAPTSIELISGDNMLKEPTVITEFSEATESDLIRINCVELVDATQWTNEGSGFNVDITDGTNTFAMRIDADTDVYGTTAPEGVFTVTGIGGQFDSSAPFDEGYQLLPRYIADVPEGLTAEVTFDGASSTTGLPVSGDIDGGFGVVLDGFLDASTEVAFTGDNDDLTYTWVYDGVTVEGNPGVFMIGDLDGWNDGNAPNLTGNLTITISDGTCTAEIETTLDMAYTGIEEYILQTLSIYPNPTSDNITLEAPVQGTVRILSSVGQAVSNVTIVNPGQETINVSHLSNGIYFLEMISGDTAYRAQFVKK